MQLIVRFVLACLFAAPITFGLAYAMSNATHVRSDPVGEFWTTRELEPVTVTLELATFSPEVGLPDPPATEGATLLDWSQKYPGQISVPEAKPFGRQCRGIPGNNHVVLICRYYPLWIGDLPPAALTSLDELMGMRGAALGAHGRCEIVFDVTISGRATNVVAECDNELLRMAVVRQMRGMAFRPAHIRNVPTHSASHHIAFKQLRDPHQR